MKTIFYNLVIILFFTSCKELPSDLHLNYVSFEKVNESNNQKKFIYELQIISSIDLYMPKEELGFASFFLYCPMDGDFENYSKDSIFYLRSCFACENVDFIKNEDKSFLFKVPVRFFFTNNKNDITYDLTELKQSLTDVEDCLECKIIYTQLPGQAKYTNSFCIPKEDILSQLK